LEWSRIKSKLGDNQGAVDKLKIAVDLNPDVEDPRWRLASAYIRAGETEKGEEEAKEARRVLSEKNPQADKWSECQPIHCAHKRRGNKQARFG